MTKDEVLVVMGCGAWPDNNQELIGVYSSQEDVEEDRDAAGGYNPEDYSRILMEKVPVR